MSISKPLSGTTQNNIPFIRLEGGPKNALLWFGGPGNNLSPGRMFNPFVKAISPLLEDYTVTFLSRRSGLPEGYTTQKMSDDYAELITTEYDGHVDLIVGFSYGGLVAQHFAADYPDLCAHIVICATAYKISDEGKALDYRYAELLNQNKPRQALQGMAGALYSNKLTIAMMRPILWLLAPHLQGDSNTEIFRKDVLIEGKAEVAHDGRDSLSRISKPTLIQGGEFDKYAPLELLQETKELIPAKNGKLIIYPGKGHNILDDKQAAFDILDWISKLESDVNKVS